MTNNVDLKRIRNHKTVCYRKDGSLKTVTKVLVFAAPIIGIDRITKRNVVEVYLRLKWLEWVRLPISEIYSNWCDVPRPPFRTPSFSDIKAHIGLRTKAACKTRDQFFKHWSGNIYYHLECLLQRHSEFSI